MNKYYEVHKYKYTYIDEDSKFYNLYDKDWDCVRKFRKFEYGICSKGNNGDDCLQDKDFTYDNIK